MSILNILQYPDSRLSKKAREVEDVKDPSVQKDIDDMFETMHKFPNCAGLSSSQLDIEHPKRISVINGLDDNPEICLINPVITEREGEFFYEEGCMSIFPGEIRAKVKRSKKIKVKAQNRLGEFVEIIAESNLFSVCIQHEIDHLDGILFIDRLSPLKRGMIEKKIKKLS